MTNVDRWILPEGVDELLPEESAAAESIRRQALDLFASWGYRQVTPPLIEFTDSLLIGMGKDLELQSFRLTDQLSGKPMAVRADITPQVARIDAHSMRAEGINRLCYAGSVLHTRAKTQLASRCPMQVGAEFYGDAAITADIEVISLMLEMFSSLTIDGITLDLGHIGIYRAVSELLAEQCGSIEPETADAIFSAIQRKSTPDLEAILDGLSLERGLSELLLALPDLCGGQEVLATAAAMFEKTAGQALPALDELKFVSAFVEERFPGVTLYFDLAEMRGFNYHTGVVFAAYNDGHGRALANGGRYDHIGEVFGAARPATGFNADVKALVEYASQQADGGVRIAAPLDKDQSLWERVRVLRAQGEVVVFSAEPTKDQCGKQLVLEHGEWQIRDV